MKLALIPALLLAAFAGPSPSIRFEADGIRVGSELVTGAAFSMKSSGELPLLVSGQAVESLSGGTLSVALDRKEVALGTGLRLARTAEGYQVSSHGLPFTVSAQGVTLPADRTASFVVTDKGFDFGALGVLEGTSFEARVSAAPSPAPAAVQDGGKTVISPERNDTVPLQRKVTFVRLYGDGDPFNRGQGANSISVRLLPRITPEGAP